ncbi:MAG: FHA domain-containing protein [Clostridia bacterium]|nr:FHA domain-containing protein [Clostridia bacterium]
MFRKELMPGGVKIFAPSSFEVDYDALNFLASGSNAVFCRVTDCREENGHHVFFYECAESARSLSGAMQSGEIARAYLDGYLQALAYCINSSMSSDNIVHTTDCVFYDGFKAQFVLVPVKMAKAPIPSKDLSKIVAALAGKTSGTKPIIKQIKRSADYGTLSAAYGELRRILPEHTPPASPFVRNSGYVPQQPSQAQGQPVRFVFPQQENAPQDAANAETSVLQANAADPAQFAGQFRFPQQGNAPQDAANAETSVLQANAADPAQFAGQFRFPQQGYSQDAANAETSVLQSNAADPAQFEGQFRVPQQGYSQDAANAETSVLQSNAADPAQFAGQFQFPQQSYAPQAEEAFPSDAQPAPAADVFERTEDEPDAAPEDDSEPDMTVPVFNDFSGYVPVPQEDAPAEAPAFPETSGAAPAPAAPETAAPSDAAGKPEFEEDGLRFVYEQYIENHPSAASREASAQEKAADEEESAPAAPEFTVPAAPAAPFAGEAAAPEFTVPAAPAAPYADETVAPEFAVPAFSAPAEPYTGETVAIYPSAEEEMSISAQPRPVSQEPLRPGQKSITIFSDEDVVPVPAGGETVILGFSGDPETKPDLRYGVLYRVSTGERFVIDKTPFVMGKDGKAVDLKIDNPAVSRVHASIVFDGGDRYNANGVYSIVDNYSTNGTSVEGIMLRPQKKYELSPDDIFTLGNESFRFRMEGVAR